MLTNGRMWSPFGNDCVVMFGEALILTLIKLVRVKAVQTWFMTGRDPKLYLTVSMNRAYTGLN